MILLGTVSSSSTRLGVEETEKGDEVKIHIGRLSPRPEEQGVNDAKGNLPDDVNRDGQRAWESDENDHQVSEDEHDDRQSTFNTISQPSPFHEQETEAGGRKLALGNGRSFDIDDFV